MSSEGVAAGGRWACVDRRMRVCPGQEVREGFPEEGVREPHLRVEEEACGETRGTRLGETPPSQAPLRGAPPRAFPELRLSVLQPRTAPRGAPAAGTLPPRRAREPPPCLYAHRALVRPVLRMRGLSSERGRRRCSQGSRSWSGGSEA